MSEEIFPVPEAPKEKPRFFSTQFRLLNVIVTLLIIPLIIFIVFVSFFHIPLQHPALDITNTIPHYPNISNQEWLVGEGGDTLYVDPTNAGISFHTTDSDQTVISFYESRLPMQGWQQQEVPVDKDEPLKKKYLFHKEDYWLSFSSYGDDSCSVTYLYGVRHQGGECLWYMYVHKGTTP